VPGFAVGDPQTSAQRYFRVLSAHGLLTPAGALARDVELVSMGDHFDFGAPGTDPSEAQRSGEQILSWLLSQRSAHLILGNHDVSRVQELASFSAERFAQARAAARPIEQRRKQRGDDDPVVVAQSAEFCDEFALPTPEIADRDFCSFTPRQRELTRQALLDERLVLARAARLADGRPVLLTHASVTRRELEILHLTEGVSAEAIADALNTFLRARVDAVRSDWLAGRATPLDLSPLHLAGVSGREGGGLLYHRATHPDRGGDAQGPARRRYDPRELPSGLVQAIGHVQHKKCLEILGEIVTDEARRLRPGALRKLCVSADGSARYGGLDNPSNPGDAELVYVDGSMNQRDLAPRDYQLLVLSGVSRPG
jgi:hypothetical protein